MAGYSNAEFTSKKFDIIGDDDFVGKVKVLLDEVWALKNDLGKEFLRELDGTPHMIGIKKGNNTNVRLGGEPVLQADRGFPQE